MSKMSKAIVALGVVAGLGVAAMPLSSYAANSDSKQAQVQVSVGGTITLTLSGEQDEGSDATWTDGTLNLGKVITNSGIAEGNITATVTSNDPIGYSLTMYATNDGVMKGDTGGVIPNVAPAANGAGWGYKTGTNPYAAMPKGTTEDPAVEIATANAGTENLNATTTVTFGVSADDTVPEGIYTGTVIFTAAAK